MKNFEMILIGNKIDKNEERIISKKEAKEKANQYGLKYFEICCLNGLNVYEVLKQIILDSYNKRYEKDPRGMKKLDSRGEIIVKDKKCC